MNTLREIIRQAQKELYCNTCRRSFELEEIRFKGQVGKTIFLQTVCMNEHPPTIMVFMAPYAGKTNLEPLNNEDLIDLHTKITKCKSRLSKQIVSNKKDIHK